MAALVKKSLYEPFLIFDGSNSTDIVTAYNDQTNVCPNHDRQGSTIALTSQTTTSAVFLMSNANGGGPTDTHSFTLAVGDGFTLNGGQGWGTSSSIDLGYVSPGGGTAPSVKYGGYGESVLGILTVGSTNVAVTIKPAQPDTGYVASAFLDGPALALGTVSVGTPVKTSASVVTVPVTNSGLLPVTLSSSTVSVNVTAPQS